MSKECNEFILEDTVLVKLTREVFNNTDFVNSLLMTYKTQAVAGDLEALQTLLNLAMPKSGKHSFFEVDDDDEV